MSDLYLFASLVLAIVLEAAPFLLLGALLGAVLEVAVPDRLLEKAVPGSLSGQVALGLFAGMVLPTCECGVVPVVRGLLRKNVPPGVALPYMLAAPVINPVVLLSTYVAFQGDWTMVAWRCVVVAIPAMGLGAALGRLRGEHILRRRILPMAPAPDHAHGHDHDHEPGCGCGKEHHGSLLVRILSHASREFLDMARFLILGAVCASLFKVFLPTDAVAFVARNLWLAVPAMLGLAVLLSVCSEADAFVAAGFSMFPRAAQLGFVGLGPMVDLKLIPMFYATFHPRVATALVVVPTVSVWAVSLLLGLLGVV